MFKRKVLFFAGALCSLLLTLTFLTGCGNGDEIVITIMASGARQADSKVFVDAFAQVVETQFPHITVEATLLPDDQYYTTLAARMASGEAPDLFLVQPRLGGGANSVFSMAEAGRIMALSGLENWEHFPQSSIDDMSFEGRPYAISSGVAFLGTYYNSDMFVEHGIHIPQNWEEFLTACQTLLDAGITPIVMGDMDSFMIQFGLYQIVANQVYPINPDFDLELYEGVTHFTDPIWVQAVEMYAELYERGFMASNTLGIGQAQSMQMFVDQEAAMTFNGSFNLEALTATDEFEAGFFALPANEPGKPLFTAGATSAGFAVSSTTDYFDEIIDILNLMTDGESELFDAWVNQPGSISIYSGQELQHDIFEDVMKLYQEGHSFYWANQAWPAGLNDEMSVWFSRIIDGQDVTPFDVTQAMQNHFEALIGN